MPAPAAPEQPSMLGQDEVKFARKELASPPFYSALERAVTASKTAKASPEQWAATLKATPGVKADELKWTGVDDWLKMQKGPVSKEDIAAFVKNNGVQVQEVELGDLPYSPEVNRYIRDDLNGRSPETAEQWLAQAARAERSARVWQNSGNLEFADNWFRLAAELEQHAEDLETDSGKVKGATKFSQWQLPGGKNYKELLLTLPNNKAEKLDARRREIEALGRGATEEQKREWVDIMNQLRPDDRDIEGISKFKGMPDFRSSHFDQPNILAHVRFNERTDADGKRVLFLEEVQSDWAQKGKRDGFQGTSQAYRVTQEKDGTWSAADEGGGGEGGFATQAEAQQWANTENARDPNAVPSAPFVTKTEAWVSLALKRMVRYAAENGFDRVAWTTGEQQAARYDLSKQIGELAYWKDGDSYGLSALDPDGRKIDSIDQLYVAEKDLEETVGKEVAQQIIEGRGDNISQMGFPDESNVRYLRGENLRVGGNGMKAFYDKIVPNAAKEISKKFGGSQVRKISIATSPTEKSLAHFYDWAKSNYPEMSRSDVAQAWAQGEGNRITFEFVKYTIHGEHLGFDITEEMRDKALGGLPLFAKKGSIPPSSPTKADSAPPNSNKATPGKIASAPFSDKDIVRIERLAEAEGWGPATRDHPFERVPLPDDQALSAIARALGAEIVGLRLSDGLLGKKRDAYDQFDGLTWRDGKIYIRADSDRPHLTILGHELAHQLRKQRPELYDQLVEAIRPYVDAGKYPDFLKSAVAKDAGSKDAQREEFIGEVFADGFQDTGFWRAVGEKNPSLLKSLIEFLADLIAKIRAKVPAFRAKQYLKDFDKVMDIAGGVLGEYSKTTAPAKPGGVAFQRAVADETQQDRRNSLDGLRISPRLPTGVKSTEDPHASERLQPSLEAARKEPQKFEHNISLMAQYPNFEGMSGDPATMAESMIGKMVENLMWLHDHWKPALRARSKMWYVGGNRIAHRWAKRFGIAPHKVAAVIAATSPQKDWFQNVSLAERILEAVINNSEAPWSDKMSNVVRKTPWGTKASGDLGYAPVDRLAEFEGKSLRDLFDGTDESVVDMAVWIRAWDEATNPYKARVITPEGGFSADWDAGKTGKPIGLRWQSFAAVAKAVKILRAESSKEISNIIGTNHKVRSFYNNIIAPFSGDDVTIDTHAVAAALLRPLGSASREVLHNFGSGIVGERGPANSAVSGLTGTYGIYAEAYRRAAKQAGILPREMQSITWEAIRGLFRPEQKQERLRAEVDRIWADVARGGKDATKAREEVSRLVGGVQDPAWVRFDPGVHEAQEDSSYAGELSEGLAPGSGGGSTSRGRGGPAAGVPDKSADVGAPKFARKGPNIRRALTPEQTDALTKAGVFYNEPSLTERAKGLLDKFRATFVQGLFDQFRPIKDLSMRAYMLARMASGSDGTLEAAMMFGAPVVDSDGAMSVDVKHGGLIKLLKPLEGEHDLFFAWVAAQRAEALKAQGRENLLTDEDIRSLKSLNQGVLPSGKARAEAYKKALDGLQALNKSFLDVAERSGIVDPESRPLWEEQFYVPFFREIENGTSGPTRKSGLVNQQTIKRLKGGTQNLKDLMENTIRNWAYLASASAKNRAALVTLNELIKIGGAIEAPEATLRNMKKRGASDNVAYVLDRGQQRWFTIEDPNMAAAIMSLESASLPAALKPFRWAKQMLTFGVTVTPAFKITNWIRDSIAVIGQTKVSANPLKNMLDGWSTMSKGSAEYAQMLASGGLFRYGTRYEDNRAKHIKRLVESGVPPENILDAPSKVTALGQKLWDAYQELGDKGENMNRGALYKQLRAKKDADGKPVYSHLEASYMARDMMDFSLQGKWAAVRFLTQVVPFMNARLQGLYKLGRASKEDRARFLWTSAALMAFSVTLMALQADDDDWKKREDWDRDAFWWIKIGGQAIYIPKPFELGAIGTIAERSVELFMSEEMTVKRYLKRLSSMVLDTFAMNPIPQAIKPAIDLYANKDSFTGRAIETMGMEYLLTEDKATGRTSEIAKGIGKAGILSPVQIDHLVRGYMGGLGTGLQMMTDAMLRPIMGRAERPASRLEDIPVAGRFLKDLPSNQSRYVTEFYEKAKEIERAFGSYRDAAKRGDKERLQEVVKDKLTLLQRGDAAREIKSQMGEINRRIKQITDSPDMSRAQKRIEIDKLRQIQDQRARLFSAAQ